MLLKRVILITFQEIKILKSYKDQEIYIQNIFHTCLKGLAKCKIGS